MSIKRCLFFMILITYNICLEINQNLRYLKIYLFEDFYSDRDKLCAIEVIIVEYILESYSC
jgi:hypothetical protein